MWSYHNSLKQSRRLDQSQLLPILKEFFNLLLISFVVIQLFQPLSSELELLAWSLLSLLLGEQLLKGKNLLLGKRQLQKEEQKRNSLKQNLKGVDVEILRKLVDLRKQEREKEKLSEVEDLVRGKLDIVEEVLKENSE